MLQTGNPKAKGEVVNVGNTQEVSIHELAEKIKEAAKCKSTIEIYPLPKDEPKRRCPNTNKLKRLIGWKPNVCFEEGLKRTLAWFSQKSRIKVLCNYFLSLGYCYSLLGVL
jgi:nucleoside-diphosphate-sugar epimerase